MRNYIITTFIFMFLSAFLPGAPVKNNTTETIKIKGNQYELKHYCHRASRCFGSPIRPPIPVQRSIWLKANGMWVIRRRH
ncbi:MAG: hypothetical protein GY757_03945 [bacterium]|nr:hypothetical protein [bacterium]